MRQSVSQLREIGDSMLMADALVDWGVVARASRAYSESKQYLLEALRTAMETQIDPVALQASLEIAVIEMIKGNKELALELVIHVLQHPYTHQEVRDRAERLQAELLAQLTPQQIEAIQAQAQAKNLESLAQEILAAGE